MARQVGWDLGKLPLHHAEGAPHTRNQIIANAEAALVPGDQARPDLVQRLAQGVDHAEASEAAMGPGHDVALPPPSGP